MLGQHPQLYSLLETRVFEVDTMQEWCSCYGKANHDGDGLVRSVAEIIYGAQSPQAVEFAKAWLWKRCSCCETADVFNELAERLFPLRLVEKTPLEGLAVAEIQQKLQRRFNRFPRARFLHVIRHPMGYCRSQLEHLERISQASPYPQRVARRYAWVTDTSTEPPIIDPQVLWYRVNLTITRFLAHVPLRQRLQIRGEDLLADLDTSLRMISEWLGVRNDAKALEEMKHPERSPFACVGPANARWGADPKFFRHPHLRVNEATDELELDKELPWRTDRKGFAKPLQVLARQFGYN